MSRKKNNKYIADAYVYLNGKRKRIRKTFQTQKEAKDFEAEARKASRQRNERSSLGISTRTFLELVNYYYSLVKFQKLKVRSQVRNRELVGHLIHWAEAVGIKYVHQFTREHAEAYASYILSQWSGKGRQHVWTAAKMLFAVECDRTDACITKNPFPKSSPFDAPHYSPIAIPRDIYTKLQEHMPPLERAFFDLLINTGCRCGELLYLYRDQVRENSIDIEQHTIHLTNGKSTLWTSKTYENRRIPLNSRAAECIETLCSLHNDQHYVVPQECRETSHWPLRSFERVKRAAVITYPELRTYLFAQDRGKAITPKTLRSTFITTVMRNTKDPVVAQYLAGHANIKTTLNHYTDMTQFNFRAGVESLEH